MARADRDLDAREAWHAPAWARARSACLSERQHLVVLLRRAVAAYERAPRAVRWLSVASWGAFLWYQSSQPPTPGPRSDFANWYHNAAHVPAFGLLAVLVAL